MKTKRKEQYFHSRLETTNLTTPQMLGFNKPFQLYIVPKSRNTYIKFSRFLFFTDAISKYKYTVSLPHLSQVYRAQVLWPVSVSNRQRDDGVPTLQPQDGVTHSRGLSPSSGKCLLASFRYQINSWQLNGMKSSAHLLRGSHVERLPSLLHLSIAGEQSTREGHVNDSLVFARFSPGPGRFVKGMAAVQEQARMAHAPF